MKKLKSLFVCKKTGGENRSRRKGKEKKSLAIDARYWFSSPGSALDSRSARERERERAGQGGRGEGVGGGRSRREREREGKKQQNKTRGANQCWKSVRDRWQSRVPLLFSPSFPPTLSLSFSLSLSHSPSSFLL